LPRIAVVHGHDHQSAVLCRFELMHGRIHRKRHDVRAALADGLLARDRLKDALEFCAPQADRKASFRACAVRAT
jgi:hypothetical protein